MRPKRVIRERHQVLEEDKTLTFRHDLPAVPIGGGGGNLFFIGMEGSGRKTLARACAERLGYAFALASSPEALADALAKSGQAVAVTGADIEDPEVITALRDSGKVFYLMSVAPILAKRLGDLSRLDELAELTARLEPHFMTAAHFVLPVGSTMEEMLEDVAEKARL